MRRFMRGTAAFLAAILFFVTIGNDYSMAAHAEVVEEVSQEATEVAADSTNSEEVTVESETPESVEAVEETSQSSEEVDEETPAEASEENETEAIEDEEVVDDNLEDSELDSELSDELLEKTKDVEEKEVTTEYESLFTFNVNNDEYGYVELIEETITVEAEDADSEEAAEAIEKTVVVGAIAYANDGYEFVNWTDADANEVSADAEFRPEGEDEATYTANFEEAEVEEENFPTQEFEQVIDGVKITASAPEGAFPEGTVMNAEKVVITETIEAAIDNATDEDVEVTEIIAYDITFTKDDEEVQPKVAISVNFSNVELEGENLQVFHMEDEEAEAEPVSEVVENTNEIEVEAESFSLYVLVGEKWVKIQDGGTYTIKVGQDLKVVASNDSNYKEKNLSNWVWKSEKEDVASVSATNKPYQNNILEYFPQAVVTGKKLVKLR